VVTEAGLAVDAWPGIFVMTGPKVTSPAILRARVFWNNISLDLTGGTLTDLNHVNGVISGTSFYRAAVNGAARSGEAAFSGGPDAALRASTNSSPGAAHVWPAGWRIISADGAASAASRPEAGAVRR
jgi:hypothetical protein